MKQLDKYEAGYSRLTINVFDEDGQSHSVVTYMKTGQMEVTTPSQQYGEILRKGYRDWGIV